MKNFFALCVLATLFAGFSSFAEEREEGDVPFWFDRSFDLGAARKEVAFEEKTYVIVEGDVGVEKNGSRSAYYSGIQKWPDGILIWKIDPQYAYDSELTSGVAEAIRQLSARTNLKFKKQTTENDYILITRSGGCWSRIGREGGKQILSLDHGCNSWYTTAHELLHAAGMMHEHTRSDRDNNIRINYSNLGPNGKSNFTVFRHVAVGPYDSKSIMHYPSMAPYGFSLNPNIPTFTLLDGSLVDYNEDLTRGDIIGVNTLYPKNDSQTDIDTDTKVPCLKIDYVNMRAFDRQLKIQLESFNVAPLCVKFSDVYTIDTVPERIQHWLTAIESSGGTVKQVAISKSWLTKIFKFIISILTGGEGSNMYEATKNYNAEVHYDELSKELLVVKFLPR